MTDVQTPDSDSRVERRGGVRVLPRPETPLRPDRGPRIPGWLVWFGAAAIILGLVAGGITMSGRDETAFEPGYTPIEGAPVGVEHLGLRDWIERLQPQAVRPHLGLQDWIAQLQPETVQHLGLQDWITRLQPEPVQHLGLQDWITQLQPEPVQHLGLQDWITQLQPEPVQHLGLQDWIDLLSSGAAGR